MTVTTLDDQGRELSRASGSDILGHPFNAVVWLARDLGARGQRLHAGDVISLGSFARPQPAEPGRSVTVVYEGRSEEHTSELQSLMRTSYAVFRLKKKKA